MRVIVEVFGRAWMFEGQSVKLAAPGEVSSQSEGFEQAPPHDPHGTLSAQVERGCGADSFTSDVVGKQGFGFRGKQE